MSLRTRLAEALAGTHRTLPLLEGDPRDPLIDEDQGVTPAAVLVPVVDRPEPTVILTVRTEAMRRHAGQIAFPGGRMDPGDAGPVDAALREAEEEIGLERRHVDVVGTADRYRTITGFEVTPVIGIVPPNLPLIPHPGEVAAIFEAGLDHILNPEHQVVRSVEWKGRERCYYEIMWQGHRIWGATAAMIVNLGRRMERVS